MSRQNVIDHDERNEMILKLRKYFEEAMKGASGWRTPIYAEENVTIHLAKPITFIKMNGLTDSGPLKFDACECGAFKVHRIGRGQPGHSGWCPWRASS